MDLLLPLVIKSIVVAGLTMGVLTLTRRRSSAERSWIAHFGLIALLFLPFAGLVLPQLHVQAPSFVAETASSAPIAWTPAKKLPASLPQATAAPSSASPASAEASSNIDWLLIAYALPVLALLGITALALLRLFALRARAEVLVEPTWLSALAHAQRRMGFKHGTALLTSSDLGSPISWGLMRPVILLNVDALNAGAQAEAIIAHELAHVARLDWAKLMLARVATALFWFNPLVWMLAREAHQLREETADDAVLAADIPETDYAELLVGVARHECKGLLLGAHGVAPGKGSLARRVRRVLDGGLPRGPVAGSFAAGVAVGAVMFAAPLAALTFAPRPVPAPAPNDRRVTPSAIEPERSLPGAVVEAVARLADRPVEQAVVAAPTYPSLVKLANGDARRRATPDELKLIGVTPDYVADLANAGYRNLSQAELAQARATGVDGDYAREISNAGYPGLTLRELSELRALRIDGDDIDELRTSMHGPLPLNTLIRVKALGGNSIPFRDRGERIELRAASGSRILMDRSGKVIEMSAVSAPPRPRMSQAVQAAEDEADTPEPPSPPEPPEDVAPDEPQTEN